MGGTFEISIAKLELEAVRRIMRSRSLIRIDASTKCTAKCMELLLNYRFE
jgi:hypothetical protein